MFIGSQMMEGLYHLFHFLTDIAVKEFTLFLVLQQKPCTQLRNHSSESLTGYSNLLSDNGVAQTDGLTKQLVVVVDNQQTLTSRVFGI